MPVPSVPSAGAVRHPLSVPRGAELSQHFVTLRVQRVSWPARRSPTGNQYGLQEVLGLMGRNPLPALPATQ